jgi:hypothetical protein
MTAFGNQEALFEKTAPWNREASAKTFY